MIHSQEPYDHSVVNVDVNADKILPMSFRPYLITVQADATDPVTPELLQREAGLALPVTEERGTLQVQAIAATPEQIHALIGYIQYLQTLPVRILDEPERELLSHWGTLRGV